MNSYETLFTARGYKFIAGVDEAGRGPLAGPVVAAAVVFGEAGYPPGIRDSKQLSPKLREELFYKICGSATAVGLGIVDVSTIDEINILRASHLAMLKALGSLEKKPDFVLIDGVFAPKTGVPQRAVPGGDAKSVSIAAASIIAKVSRDRMMLRHHERFPGYGFDEHKGYGTKAHLESLNRLGPCRIHRMSFRPVAAALNLRLQKSS